MTGRGLHLNLDDAWRNEPFALPVVDARDWGPQLRFSAPPRLIAEFYREHEARLPSFLLFGSGDFHHLTALWIQRLTQPVILVSFDNHPDWDVRPPKWGCGNFECWWPHQVFGNRQAERAGLLEVHPWADGHPPKDQQRRGAILRDNWRGHFEQFVKDLGGMSVYVTIDLDCLRPEEAVTNWESGRFAIVDLEWALTKLHESLRIVGGDICGAYSSPHYARFKQRFAAEFDHPKLQLPALELIRTINSAALARLWPVLAQ